MQQIPLQIRAQSALLNMYAKQDPLTPAHPTGSLNTWTCSRARLLMPMQLAQYYTCTLCRSHLHLQACWPSLHCLYGDLITTTYNGQCCAYPHAAVPFTRAHTVLFIYTRTKQSRLCTYTLYMYICKLKRGPAHMRIRWCK